MSIFRILELRSAEEIDEPQKHCFIAGTYLLPGTVRNAVQHGAGSHHHAYPLCSFGHTYLGVGHRRLASDCDDLGSLGCSSREPVRRVAKGTQGAIAAFSRLK
jgi:hypothetical protein